MNPMPVLETNRLFIRAFQMDDLEAAYRLFDIELNADEIRTENVETMDERVRWLEWSVLNDKQLASMNQPPYGDRAIILKSTHQLIGSCGFVPCLNAFEQMPNFEYYDRSGNPGFNTTEFGLFYAISASHRHQGFASEATQALIDYAFGQLHLKRIIATTNFDNVSSMAVMRKLGMTLEKNPLAGPPWLQVVGVLENKNM